MFSSKFKGHPDQQAHDDCQRAQHSKNKNIISNVNNGNSSSQKFRQKNKGSHPEFKIIGYMCYHLKFG